MVPYGKNAYAFVEIESLRNRLGKGNRLENKAVNVINKKENKIKVLTIIDL